MIPLYQNMTWSDVVEMGKAMAHSQMYGCSNEEQGTVFAAQCVAEGKTPFDLAKTYHLVKGKLSMRSDAMLAAFRNAGGKMKFADMNNDEVQKAIVEFEGTTIEVEYSIEMAKKAGLIKSGMYERFGRNMLRARLITETIRAIAPELILGAYTPEEIEDFDADDVTPIKKGKLPETKGNKAEKVRYKEDPSDDVPTDFGAPISVENFQKLETYWKALDYREQDKIEAIRSLGNKKAESFAALTAAEGGRLIAQLQDEMNKLAEKKSVNKPETPYDPPGEPEKPEPPEPPEPGELATFPDEIDAWLNRHATRVNQYLIQIRWIKEGQSYTHISQKRADTIAARTDAFAKNIGIEKMERAAG